MTVVIRNPASGRGAGARRWHEIEALLKERGVEFESLCTEGSGHAFRLAGEAVRGGARVVAACGGDGTISEVACGLIGSGASLGVIPLGTGNDFARHIGLGTNLHKAVEWLADGSPRQIDAVHWQVGEESGHFINVAGTGFDAVTAERVNQGFRMLRGTSAYIAAVLATLAKFQPVNVRLEIDGERYEGTAMLCAIANASSYGGGMKVAPQADVSDGLLDVVLVGGVGRGEFLRTFPKVFKGTHTSHPAVKTWRAKRVRVEASPLLPVLCDGELRGMTPAEFEVVPAALSVIREAVWSAAL